MPGICGFGVFAIGWERLLFRTAIECRGTVVFSRPPRTQTHVV